MRGPLLAFLALCGAVLGGHAHAATGTGDRAAPSAESVNPGRFGQEADAAYGAYQRGLYRTAYNLALPRAEAGEPAAQTLVAEILARGLGVPRDEKGAARWYQAASEQGVPEAQFQYALLLLDGRLVPRDDKGAYALMEAAAEAGNLLAQFNLAQIIMKRAATEDALGKAAGYYQRAAEAGLPDAQYALSQLYAEGFAGKPKDEAEARKWLDKAARQGFDTAQLDLGSWLVEGRGGAKDESGGFHWLKVAAERGNAAAQNRVAKLYMYGVGTPPDNLFAAAWYILARRSGLSDPEMEDFMAGLTDEETKTALQRANRLR
ncbi:MAG: tetratricopeptide repeat protein [Rhizobiaceae bacterium]